MTSRFLIAAAFGLGVALLGAVALGLGREDVAVAQTNCSTTTGALSGVEIQMVEAINAERAKQGAGPLLVSPPLNDAAAWMAENFNLSAPSHFDHLGRGPSERARDCGYPGGAAENIAWGYGSVSSTLTGWMNSPGHRTNILNPRYVVIGVGNAGGTWVTNFGTVEGPGAYAVGSPPPPPPPATATPTQPGVPTQPPQVVSPTPSPTPTSVPTVQPQPDYRFLPSGVVVPRLRMPMLASE